MTLAKKILGEDNQEQAGNSWPKSVVTRTSLKSISHACHMFDKARGDTLLKKAILDAINFDSLRNGINRWMTSPVDHSFEDDAGLIFDNRYDPYGVEECLKIAWESNYMVRPGRVGSGTLAVADQQLAEILGEWLKSIGVPFKYNVEPESQQEERPAAAMDGEQPTAPVLPATGSA